MGLNALLKPLGTGAFHCGVEVYGIEWSYSDTTSGQGEGIFTSKPRLCEGHAYCESVQMGGMASTEEEVLRLVLSMQATWTVATYHTLKKNCCHFSDEFCHRLGAGAIPAWVMNLAGAGAAIVDVGDTCRALACCNPALAGAPVELVDSYPSPYTTDGDM